VAFRSLRDLTTAVLNELTLVPGSSVQTYAEPQIVHAINIAFDSLFGMRFWGHLTVTTQHDVDPTTGLITDTITNIDSQLDILWIRHYPYEERDVHIFLDGNEWHDNDMAAYRELPWADPARTNKLVQIFPNNIGVPIRIRARRKLSVFEDPDTIIPMDNLLMLHYTTMNLLASDGINPNGQQQQALLFNKRYEDITTTIAGNVSEYRRGTSVSTFTVV